MTRSRLARRTARAHSPLFLQPLEDRAVPAFTMAIDGDIATANVSSVFAGDTTTFTATGNGATLNVDDIEAALANGHVLITTGSGGSQAGNVTWLGTSVDDDLDYFDAAPRTLTIRPSGSATVGTVTTNLINFNLNDNVDLVIDTTAPGTDGNTDLLNNSRIHFARSVTLNAGTGRVRLNSSTTDPMAQSGGITITASLFQNTDGTFTLLSDQGDVTFNAPIDLSTASFGVRSELGAVILNDTVDGGSDLTLYGATVAINDAVGGTTPLDTLTIAGGDVSFGTNTIEAGTIAVGDGVFDPFEAAFGAGTGTVTGNISIEFDGNLAPGGAGTVGTLTLVGDLTFNDGDYALDLGATSDNVVVTGDVAINFGRLGAETSTGALGGAANVQVMSLTGTLTGEFFNAPVDSPLVVGADAVVVTNYGPAPTGLTIAQVPGAPLGKATGVEFDGTAYTVRLTGPGQLVAFTDVLGLVNVVTRNTTPLSRVAVTTKPNASDDLVAIGPIHINGPLAAFFAPKVVLTAELRASAKVSALAFANVFAPIVLGGQSTDKTSIRAESLFTSVTATGVLSAITTTGDLGASIGAAGIGAMKVGGSLTGLGERIEVTNGIKSIVAARVEGMDLSAKFLGTLAVTGNVPRHVAGDLVNSIVRLTGNDETLGRFGLKMMTVKGNVIDSTIYVEEGNVATATVGRFINSRLYLDYTEAGLFNAGGTFNSAGNFKLTKFTTTALNIGDLANPNNWAFASSQVVADTIGTVRLSGLRTDNFGDGFGFKFRNTGGSVQAKTTDGSILLNVNLTPGSAAIDGDFFFLDV